MSSHYLPNQGLSKGQFNKQKIADSASAFTNDITHIKTFGVSPDSPFSRVELYPPHPAAPSPEQKQPDYPVLMKADGYTRSSGLRVIPTHRQKSAQIKEMLPLITEKNIIGNKQETGSLKNNKPYIELKEPDPQGRFTTENNQQ